MIVDRILQFIDYKKINKRKLYIETGLSNGFLDKVKDIGASKIEQILYSYPEINPEWLLTGKGNMINPVEYPTDDTDRNNFWSEEPNILYKAIDKIIDKQKIPLYNSQTPDGMVSLFTNLNQKPIDYVSIPDLPKCDGAIYVSGDSMFPLLKSGDIIVYKKTNHTAENILWGEMYLISVKTEDAEDFVLIKWVKKSDKGEDWIKLESENTHHESKDIRLDTIQGMALIKATIRINSTY